MATEVNSIPSSASTMILAEEASIGVPQGSPQYFELKPTSYANNFGPTFELVSERVISQRRRLRGDIVGETVEAGFEFDMTPTRMDKLLPAIFHAVFDKQANKGTVFDTGITVAGTPVDYDIGADAATAGWEVGHLLFAENFGVAANNGLKEVTGVLGNTIEAAGLALEASPPATAVIRAVGIQFGAGELDVVKTGGQYPIIQRALGTLNWTDFNLKPGSRIFIDQANGAAANRFVNAQNNGWMRVLAVTATDLTIDRADGGADGVTDMVSETGTGLSIRVFISDRIVDTNSEEDTAFQKVSHFIERRLGIPNPVASPGVIQTEDVLGGVIDTAAISVAKKSKSVVNVGMLAIGSDEHTGEPGDERVTDGQTILSIEKSEFFNNSSHVVRSLASLYPDASAGNAAPDALINFVDNYELAFSNQSSVLEAVGRAAGFDVNVVGLILDITLLSWFTTVATRKSIRANDRIQFEIAWQRIFGGRNVAFMFDAPNCGLGGGAVQIENAGSMTQPITLQASESEEHDQTASGNIFWYIP